MGRLAGAVIALDHHASVEGKAGEDRQGRVAVEAVGVVEIGNVLARLAECRDLELAVDPEGLADRDRDVGFFQREGGGRSRWLNGWHYSLLSLWWSRKGSRRRGARFMRNSWPSMWRKPG